MNNSIRGVDIAVVPGVTPRKRRLDYSHQQTDFNETALSRGRIPSLFLTVSVLAERHAVSRAHRQRRRQRGEPAAVAPMRMIRRMEHLRCAGSATPVSVDVNNTAGTKELLTA
jgi:hypothetical protein